MGGSPQYLFTFLSNEDLYRRKTTTLAFICKLLTHKLDGDVSC